MPSAAQPSTHCIENVGRMPEGMLTLTTLVLEGEQA